MDLLEDGQDDFALHGREPAAFDGLLEFRLPARHNGGPVVTAAVHGVHASLGAGRVGVTRVLAQNRADEAIQHRGTVAAAGARCGRDDLLRPRSCAVQRGQDAVCKFAFCGRRVGKGWKRGFVRELGVGLEFFVLECTWGGCVGPFGFGFLWRGGIVCEGGRGTDQACCSCIFFLFFCFFFPLHSLPIS